MLTKRVEHTEPQYTFSPKVRIEMRNDGESCLNVTTSRWIPGRKGVPAHEKLPSGTWQVSSADRKWSPEVDGADTAHLRPAEKFRTWIAFQGEPLARMASADD